MSQDNSVVSIDGIKTQVKLIEGAIMKEGHVSLDVRHAVLTSTVEIWKMIDSLEKPKVGQSKEAQP